MQKLLFSQRRGNYFLKDNLDYPIKEHSTSSASGFEVKVDGQTAESWADLLAQFEDANIYQTWAYGTIRWGSKNLSHMVIRHENQIVAAAQLRIARVPLISTGIAYLRWGPICQQKDRTLTQIALRKFVECLRNEYCKRRGLSLQIIPNAYVGERTGTMYAESLKQTGFQAENTVAPYRTIIVDLADTAESLRKGLDQKWRNQLNRSEKNGLVLEISKQPAAFSEFLRLYGTMQERKQFETSVNATEFDRIQGLLPSNTKMQVFLAKRDEHAVAALVCSLIGNSAIYILGATDNKARELKAAYYLHWQAMLWLKEHGARWYDLGGIDREANPGGHHFKSGLRGKEVVQLPSHTFIDGGILGRVTLRGAAWLKRCRKTN